MLNENERKYAFAWILDENLLRDEGIIYGLSGSDFSDRLATIDLYFQEKIVSLETEILLRRQTKTDLVNIIKATEEVIASQTNEKEKLYTNPVEQPHQFYPTIFRFFCFALIIACSGIGVYQWLEPYWQHPLLVTIGVYVFGVLSLYHQDSILYKSKKEVSESGRELWKILLEEFAIPLIATLFIIIWGIGDTPIWKAIIFGLLIFSVFLFSGKALLGSMSQAHQQFLLLRSNWLSNKHKKRVIKSIRQELAEMNVSIVKDKENIQALEKEIAAIHIDLEALQQERELKKSYFLSEYHLAASYTERAETYKRQAHG